MYNDDRINEHVHLLKDFRRNHVKSLDKELCNVLDCKKEQLWYIIKIPSFKDNIMSKLLSFGVRFRNIDNWIDQYSNKQYYRTFKQEKEKKIKTIENNLLKENETIYKAIVQKNKQLLRLFYIYYNRRREYNGIKYSLARYLYMINLQLILS